MKKIIISVSMLLLSGSIAVKAMWGPTEEELNEIKRDVDTACNDLTREVKVLRQVLHLNAKKAMDELKSAKREVIDFIEKNNIVAGGMQADSGINNMKNILEEASDTIVDALTGFYNKGRTGADAYCKKLSSIKSKLEDGLVLNVSEKICNSFFVASKKQACSIARDFAKKLIPLIKEIDACIQQAGLDVQSANYEAQSAQVAQEKSENGVKKTITTTYDDIIKTLKDPTNLKSKVDQAKNTIARVQEFVTNNNAVAFQLQRDAELDKQWASLMAINTTIMNIITSASATKEKGAIAGYITQLSTIAIQPVIDGLTKYSLYQPSKVACKNVLLLLAQKLLALQKALKENLESR